MSFVAGHGAGDNPPVQNADQKPLRPDPKFALDVAMGIVPRPDQIASAPKFHNGLFIVGLEGSDLYLHRKAR
jgi:hypothetical protein